MRSKYFENKEHLMDTRWTFAESIFECYVEMGRSAAKVGIYEYFAKTCQHIEYVAWNDLDQLCCSRLIC